MAIFSRDGFVRFVRLDHNLEIEIYEKEWSFRSAQLVANCTLQDGDVQGARVPRPSANGPDQTDSNPGKVMIDVAIILLRPLAIPVGAGQALKPDRFAVTAGVRWWKCTPGQVGGRNLRWPGPRSQHESL
jgi:hypothetical protein